MLEPSEDGKVFLRLHPMIGMVHGVERRFIPRMVCDDCGAVQVNNLGGRCLVPGCIGRLIVHEDDEALFARQVEDDAVVSWISLI